MDEEERDDDDFAVICPMTGTYCQGDLAHLCDEYGCARKVGESPYSEYEQELMGAWTC